MATSSLEPATAASGVSAKELRIRYKQDMKNLSLILKDLETTSNLSDKAKAICQWYTTDSCESAASKSRNRVFNALLDLGKVGSKCIADIGLLESFQEVFSCSPDRESGILLMRYYIANDQTDMAAALYRSQDRSLTRKRHADLLVKSYVSQGCWAEAFVVFKDIIERYPCPGVCGDDVLPFLNPECTVPVSDVLELVKGQPLKLGESSTELIVKWGLDVIDISVDAEAGSVPVSVIDFSVQQTSTLMDNLNETFALKGKHPKPDLSEHYDYIVDGANVMFYNELKITKNSYKRVSYMLRALRNYHKAQVPDRRSPKILLVLHQRHFTPPKKIQRDAKSEISYWEQNPDVTICRTPRNLNDDHYSLLNAFPRPGSLLVTNDKFRDHILRLSSKDHNLDLIAQWRQEKVVEYDMKPWDEGNIDLFMPIAYSFRVQHDDTYYYIPYKMSENGRFTKWVRVNKA